VAFICLSLSRHPPAASRSGRLPTLKGPGALLSLALRTWMLRCLHWNKNWWRVAGRFQLPRPLLEPRSTTEAQRAQIDRGGAATAHQATGSARKPPNPPLLPPAHHGRDHAAGDHEQRRFQLPRSLFDPSITTEAQRAQIGRGEAATAHQATGSARKPPNPPQMPPAPQRPRSRCK